MGSPAVWPDGQPEAMAPDLIYNLDPRSGWTFNRR